MDMADGKYHQMATITVGAAAAAFTFSTGRGELWPVAAGTLLALLVNPDRDLRVQSSDFKLAKWTMGLGLLWTIIWWPYSSLIPRHRHILSHLPILGTAGRVAYMAVWVAAAAWLTGRVELVAAWWSTPPAALLTMVILLALADALHWLMDMCPIEL